MITTPMNDALVLVVDDTEVGRYAKVRMLSQAGFRVIEAATGTEAIQLVDAQKPDVVVLDVQLPDIDGWEVCRRIKAVDGAPLVLQVSATFIHENDTVRALDGGADGCLTEPIDPAVMVATVRALLRMRRAEEATREALAREQIARRLAESANRAKDEFLATLSHELRSPLGTILTWVTMLKEGRLDADRTRQGLEAIERSTNLQVSLISDLLDISSIISGKTRLDISAVDLGAVVQAALDGIRATAEAKKLVVEISVEPALPRIAGDAGRLQQIASNLLSNAVKFTPEGGRIDVGVACAAGIIALRVHDTGKGISPEFLPYIFERFRQADSSTTRREGGLGLGLAIVRHLVELHRGTVEARSDGPGRGTTFTVRLPATAAAEGTKASVAATRAVSGALSLVGIRVLVVDDEHDAREAISTALTQHGADCRAYGAVEPAVSALDGTLPDVIVADIAMPNEDGYSLIRRVRSRPADRGGLLPVIALTAYGRLADRAAILSAGFDECLTKPIQLQELMGVLRRLARR